MTRDRIFGLFIKYYYGDQVKEGEMARTCNIYEGDEKCIQNFSQRT